MSQPQITLNDRFDLEKNPVLLNGTQALVRLMLMQRPETGKRALTPRDWSPDTAGRLWGQWISK